MKGNAHDVRENTPGRNASLGAMGATKKVISGETAQKAMGHPRLGIKGKLCATIASNQDTSRGNT